MSRELEIVAILSPAPGKADRIIEILDAVGKHILEKEPGTLRYQLLKQTGENPKVVVIEKYKDGAALKAHGQILEYKEGNKTMKNEKLFSGPAQLYILRSVGGFASRL